MKNKESLVLEYLREEEFYKRGIEIRSMKTEKNFKCDDEEVISFIRGLIKDV